MTASEIAGGPVKLGGANRPACVEDWRHLVWQSSPVRGHVLLTALALAELADSADLMCSPSLGELADMVGMGGSAKALVILARHGFIVVDHDDEYLDVIRLTFPTEADR
jgi:hypothetical protein